MAAFRARRSRSMQPATHARLGEPTGYAGNLAPEKSLTSAAVPVRQTEVDAADRLPPPASFTELDRLNIDQLRSIAGEFGVPNRGKIVERAELVAAIGRRM